jgi:TetR/AcrR family acrAB operon transcriptional repressor
MADEERPLGKAAQKALATRAALVELATELFAERGYAQTSIRDIARQGNLTSGAIYGHFRNKADLLVEAINQRTAEELEAQTVGVTDDPDYVEALTRTARTFRGRRRLRALILQGAAAAQTDDETREKLREEQLSHLDAWIAGYEADRERQGIDPAVDVPTAVLATWALELGLGVLEAVGIEPRSAKAWSDIQNRIARSFQLPPDDQERKRPRRKVAGRSGARARGASS